MEFAIYSKDKELITKLQSTTEKNHEYCIISENILRKSNGRLNIKSSIPIIDVQGYWTPALNRPVMQLHWNIDFSCAAHRNFPYICFFNQAHINRGSLGISNLFDDSVIIAKMNQETGNYDLDIEISVSSQTQEFKIFWDNTERNWTKILHDYRVFARPEWQPQYPESAWEPVYCTWYAVHAAIEKQWLDSQAKAAADMGFGTFIVDDGWCFDDMKRVTPETIGSWYEKIGDWLVTEKQLPDFKTHVEKVQKLGLKYLLWVSPFMIGNKSNFYNEVNCKYLSELHEGYKTFDPSSEEAVCKSMNNMLNLVNDYNLDGLKIDFVDAVPQSTESPHGRDVYNYMKTLTDKLKSKNSDTLIEFRQRYSTPVMLDIATQFRAGDVPFDYIENLHRIAQIRVCLGDKVPVHADPVYWNPDESNENIARHMMCALAGVPMVSMDLIKLPEEQKTIIEFWLNFYKDKIELFKFGNWKINYNFDHLASIEVENDHDKIVFICDPSSLPTTQDSCTVLNITHNDLCLPNEKKYNCLGNEVNSDFIPAAGYAIY